MYSPADTIEAKCMPVKPGAKHHDEPIGIPKQGRGYCVICGQRTRKMCWGCVIDIGKIFPVCTTRQDCHQRLHQIRNEI